MCIYINIKYYSIAFYMLKYLLFHPSFYGPMLLLELIHNHLRNSLDIENRTWDLILDIIVTRILCLHRNLPRIIIRLSIDKKE